MCIVGHDFGRESYDYLLENVRGLISEHLTFGSECTWSDG
jgi:hypothetical protein